MVGRVQDSPDEILYDPGRHSWSLAAVFAEWQRLMRVKAFWPTRNRSASGLFKAAAVPHAIGPIYHETWGAMYEATWAPLWAVLVLQTWRKRTRSLLFTEEVAVALLERLHSDVSAQEALAALASLTKATHRSRGAHKLYVDSNNSIYAFLRSLQTTAEHPRSEQ